MNTSERFDEHYVGYTNIAISLAIIGSQLSLRLKPRLPLKLTHCSSPMSSKLISSSQSNTLYPFDDKISTHSSANHGLQDRFHGACSSIKCPGCQTHIGQALEINPKGFPWSHRPDQVFAIACQQYFKTQKPRQPNTTSCA